MVEPSRKKKPGATEKLALGFFLLRAQPQMNIMKNKSIVLEILAYSLILVFLIVPPFFSESVRDAGGMFDWEVFPVRQMGLCLFALILYFIFEKYFAARRMKYVFPFHGYFKFFILVIIIVHLLIRHYSTINVSVPGPRGWNQIINFILTFLFSAIYEEIIYRAYFPGETIRFFTLKKDSKFLVFLGELAGALVFAFAHFYMGWFSVLNAFMAHIFFRWFYKSYGLIWNCVLIHFLYNIISAILS